MNEIEIEKDWCIKRVAKFIEDLKNQTNPLDIETTMYSIYITARRAYTVAHLLNGKTSTRGIKNEKQGNA